MTINQPANLLMVPTVRTIVIPLVRLLAEGDLSWSDRELISKAIDATVRQYPAMEKERQYLAQQSVGAQQLSPGPNYNTQRGDNP